jgi:hypothetical protein
LVGFRLLGCAVGAALPVLSFQAARRGGVSFAAAAIASSMLCLQAQQLKYTALAFPDGLAAAFALGACWALAAGSVGWALAWSAACVAAKESFVLVPVLIALLQLTKERSRMRARHWVALACPLLYVAVVALLPMLDRSLRMQGWSTTPFTFNYARNMWLGPEVWPFIAWLAWKRQARVLALWLTLPAFYFVWSMLLGRGIAPWYVLGPAALASVALAYALDVVYRACERSYIVRIGVVGLCVCCFAPLPLYGLSRTREQLSRIGARFPMPRLPVQVIAIIEQSNPAQLLLINCFWAYGYSHLRAGKPPDATWWHRPEDAEAVLQRAQAASMFVVCREPRHEQAEQALRRLPRAPLFEDRAYLVLGEPTR